MKTREDIAAMFLNIGTFPSLTYKLEAFYRAARAEGISEAMEAVASLKSTDTDWDVEYFNRALELASWKLTALKEQS